MQRHAFVCQETRRKAMINAIKWELLVFVLFASTAAIETRAILDLESSGSELQVYDYAP
jgi:hypothetical protein